VDADTMVLRLRGEFGRASEFTLRARGRHGPRPRVDAGGARARGESAYAEPVELPATAVDVEIVLTAREDGEERRVATYTLVHGGSLHR
jgi:hypothetical protein